MKIAPTNITKLQQGYKKKKCLFDISITEIKI